jgi:poly(A) polymerase
MTPFSPLPDDGYLVGGALRDALLKRPFSDIDWLVAEPVLAARAMKQQIGGSAFPLDEARGHWRLVGEGMVRDFIPLTRPLKADLASRDFTINAVAAKLDGTLVDPLGGVSDLRQRLIRMVHPDNLRADPLRPLRGVRLAAQLGFAIEAQTQREITAVTQAQLANALPLPAWERVREELDKLLLTDRAGQGFKLLAELGLLKLYLPELEACRGVAQGGFHHLDVLGHSLEALNQLVQGFPEAGLSVRWATLLHDIGKPACKSYDEAKGYYHFYGHDRLGAELAQQCLKRVRHSDKVAKQVAQLVRYHMLPLPKNRKEARRFVHKRQALLPELLQLMLADREAARGPLSSEAARTAYRLAVGNALAVAAETPKPPPLLDGREVMALLNLSGGPRVGEALRFIREAAAVGDIHTVEEAKAALKHYAARQGWLEVSREGG